MITREQRRAMILNAALKVFSQKGINEATIENIAKEAEVGKGTVYEYFESKKSLFQEMIKFSVTQYHENLKKSLLVEGSLRVKLINLLKYHMKFLSENIDIIHTAAEPNNLSKDMRHWMMNERKVIFSQLKKILDEAKQNGEMKKSVNTELAVFCLIGTANQYGGNRVIVNKTGTNDAELEAVVSILLGGIGS